MSGLMFNPRPLNLKTLTRAAKKLKVFAKNKKINEDMTEFQELVKDKSIQNDTELALEMRNLIFVFRIHVSGDRFPLEISLQVLPKL